MVRATLLSISVMETTLWTQLSFVYMCVCVYIYIHIYTHIIIPAKL